MHDRQQERLDLIRLFERGDSAQLLAPRRLGKTWLMNRVAMDLNKKGWLAIVIDVEGMRGEQEYLRALCHKLQQADPIHKKVFARMGQRLNQMVSGDWTSDPIDAISRVSSKDFAEALISSLDAQERDTVILVDEIALFLLRYLRHDPDGAHDFLYNLRRLQQGYPSVRWLLTGSIGLDVVARRANLLGALVDFETFRLEPFDRSQARSYVEALCSAGDVLRPFYIAEDEFTFLADELGWLAPYYLKLVADRIDPTGDETKNGRRLATHDDVEAAFAQLLEPHRRGSFSVWEEHIDKNFEDKETQILECILSVCCESVAGGYEQELLTKVKESQGEVSERELSGLLTALNNDGVLVEKDGRWSFCSGLLRRYWLKYWHL